MLGPNILRNDVVRTDSPIAAASLALESVQEITTETAKSLSGVFGKMLSGTGGGPGEKLSGPIGLVRTGSQVVSSSDLPTILLFMAAISVNLAVLNSFPIPALDGGQMVFILFEAFTGRKVEEKLQEGLTAAAALFLLSISLSTTFTDVQALFR